MKNSFRDASAPNKIPTVQYALQDTKQNSGKPKSWDRLQVPSTEGGPKYNPQLPQEQLLYT